MILLPSLLSFSLLQTDALAGQLPKRDLGVEAFLRLHPDWDGRGIRVAVLDTGVDPGHPFLQRTPTGERKLVDWYDATSDGRLDTSRRVVSKDGFLLGLAGRRLDLGSWFVADREFRLGRLDSEFLPAGLRSRLLADRRSKWEKGRRDWKEARTRWAADHPEDSSEASLREMETTRHWQKFEDVGPVHDVVVFEDSKGFVVLVDLNEDAQLDDDEALRPFRDSGDWGTLLEADLHFAVGVENGGDQTLIFFDANGHGTHVAGIIGAWEGESGRLNGIAPGVEFVAIKIGDGKYGGATSGFSIAKALDYAVEAGCHVANISFGGPSFFADGREPDAWVIEEARRRGLITVSSAGNEGPTLTTVGAPATARGAFAIAAAVWPDTQKVNYGSLDPTGPVLFDFSSRGPLPTGDLGVDFTAPGAALSSLPSWSGSKGENYNGTSMAAPQATGCVALLLCAATGEDLPRSPDRIYRAMRLAAEPLPGAQWVDQGHGAIRMLPSLEALRTLAEYGHADRQYAVTVANPYGSGGGIYVRQPVADRPFEVRVNVKPIFDEDAPHAEKSRFLRTFLVQSEADWVTTPEAIYSSAAGRTFVVRVDSTQLSPGLHSTRLLLQDADGPAARGVDIIVPVTVIRPHEVSTTTNLDWRDVFPLQPGELDRNFFAVPAGATHARVKLTQNGHGKNEYRTGAGSVSGFLFEGHRQTRGRFLLNHAESASQTVPVESGTVFEYTVASRWATNVAAEITLEVEFLGLQAQASTWVVPAGQGVGYLAIKSPLQAQTVSVKASLDGVAWPITVPMQVIPDPIRATVLGGRGMFYGIMEWEERFSEKTSLSLYTPHSIQTTEIREDLMLEVFDAWGDVVVRKVVYEWETELGSLDRGEYLFRLTFPSLGAEPLEARFAGVELRAGREASSPTLYASLNGAMQEENSLRRMSIPFMGVRTVFARIPDLTSVRPGGFWFGSLTFKDGDDTLLTVPLRVERPGESSVAVEASARGVGSEEQSAWQEAQVAETPDPSLLLKTARAWFLADSANPEASLAVLLALARAGFPEKARLQATGFLSRFPNMESEFLAAAPEWNL